MKAITIKGDAVKEKVKLFCFIRFGGLPNSELNLLLELLYLSVNNQLVLDIKTSRSIRNKLNMSPSLFSTNSYRLEQKGIINKNGKTITILPLFAGLNDEPILIKFAN